MSSSMAQLLTLTERSPQDNVHLEDRLQKSAFLAYG